MPAMANQSLLHGRIRKEKTMNKDLECALAMISRLVGIAIRNRPSEESKRRTFYVDMLKSIKITAGAAIRQPPCRETRKPKRKR